MLLQYLSLKLGIVTGRDLAQACRDSYPKPVSFALWILAEIAITACDLAEVIGSAIALNLLFKLPLIIGVIITALDVLILLFLQKRGFRYLEAVVITLIAVIMIAFGAELFLSQPVWGAVLSGFIPNPAILANHEMLYIAIGILGATVMPHNLYMHSAVVQTRKIHDSVDAKRQAIHFAALDSTVALLLAFFVNAGILILSASVFYTRGLGEIAEIQDAYKLLAPILGTSLASILFALALFASGHNSTITGTLSGQIVMEGFIHIKLKPWVRRIITRLLAIIPAILVIAWHGDHGLARLLILSQVVLSIQLPFAIFPLIAFTSNKKKMGQFVNRPLIRFCAIITALVITGANIWLIVSSFIPA
jgi:manganese transport protein